MAALINTSNIAEAALSIRDAVGDCKPEIAIILGSGLSTLGDAVEDARFIDYADVAHMPQSTAPGHLGRFIVGKLEGHDVICMQGRIHAYEGRSAHEICFPIYVMKALGADKFIVTNAAGGINADFDTGDLMLIEDHINFTGKNPCIGLDDSNLGPYFFDMTHGYDPHFKTAALIAAEHCGVKLQRGVYIADLGPSFETPAEIRAFRTWGADAVGMSTALEVIAANQLGMRVLGISLISNPAAGVSEAPLEIDDVAKAARLAAHNMEALLKTFLAELIS